jgi:hypothetical protein
MEMLASLADCARTGGSPPLRMSGSATNKEKYQNEFRYPARHEGIIEECRKKENDPESLLLQPP